MSVYADLLRYPDLFNNLFRRELNSRYKGSLLGLGWTFVNPLVLVLVYTLVFSVLWKAAGTAHYPLFVVSGLVVWIFFSSTVQLSAASLLGHANLIRQVRFPRQLLPLALVGANLVNYVLMLAIVIVLNLIFIPATRSTIWAAPLLSVPLVALVSGLSLIVASLTVLYRDIEHLLLTIMLPWFFLTPVFYELSNLPGVQGHHGLELVLRWVNFPTPYVESIRGPLFHGQYPSLTQIVYVCAVGLGSLLLGAFVFRRLDDQLAIEV